MKIQLSHLFYIALFIVVLWFLYIEKAIFTPFIIAAIFAYIFNPVVNFFSEKMRLPRTLSIIIIYAILIGLFVTGSIMLTSRIIEESSDLREYVTRTLGVAKTQLSALPDWLRPTVYDLLLTFQRSRFINFFQTPSFFPFFSQAISRVISFLIFLFSGYYFLKDGGNFFTKVLSYIPHAVRGEVEQLLKKSNLVLNGYLRGQIFLVFLMSVFTYIALLILGVRFAVILAVFSGFAEIVPVIGPIVAASVAMLVVLITGNAHFGLSPVNAAIVIGIIYFVLRHLEDYFIMPYVFGAITKLPPFIIFFSVIAGGHIGGVLGLILAVPVAAIMRIVLEFSFNKINFSTKKS